MIGDLSHSPVLSLLVSLDTNVLAVSHTSHPLLPSVKPLLADLVHATEVSEVFLNGQRYVVQRELLWHQAGELLGMLLVFWQPTELLSDRRLGEMALAIASKLEIEHVLEQVVRFAMDLLDADAGALPIYDPDRDRLLPGHLVNLPVDLISPVTGERKGLMWQIINQNRSLLIADYAAQSHVLPELVRAGVRSLLATPIKHGNTPLGILALYRMRDEPFQERDRDLLQAIARQTAIALQSARMYQRAIRNADQRYALYRASVEIGATLDLAQLYQAIHRAVSKLVDHVRFAIALPVDHQTFEYVYLIAPAGQHPTRRESIAKGVAGYVLRVGVSLRLSGAQSLPEPTALPDPEIDGDLTRGSLLATPLIVADRIIGALVVASDRRDAYTTNDLSALEMLASTVAVALHNALRFAHLQSLAITDTLTELVNRRQFLHLLHQEMERARRYQHPLSVAIIDLDHFKLVNDTHGHLVGDWVLREIAQCCRRHLRDIDTLARYGGEEFSLILPETDYEAALQVADRLRLLIATTPMAIDGRLLSLTLSIGVATFQSQLHTDPARLIADADQALYLAKRRGRNLVCGAKELSTYAES